MNLKFLLFSALSVATALAQTPPQPFTNAQRVSLPGNPAIAHATFSQDGATLVAYLPGTGSVGLWSVNSNPALVASFPCPVSAPDGIAVKDDGDLLIFNSQQCALVSPKGVVAKTLDFKPNTATILCHSFNAASGILTLGTSSGIQEWDLMHATAGKNFASGQIVSSLDVAKYGPPITGRVLAYTKSVICAGDPADCENLTTRLLPDSATTPTTPMPVKNEISVQVGQTLLCATSLERSNAANPRTLLVCSRYASQNDCTVFLCDFQTQTMKQVSNLKAESADFCSYSKRYQGFVLGTHMPLGNGLAQYSIHFIDPNKPAAPVLLDTQAAAEYHLRLSPDDLHALVVRKMADGKTTTELVTLP